MELEQEEADQMRRVLASELDVDYTNDDNNNNNSNSDKDTFVLNLEEQHKIYPALPRESGELSPMDPDTAQEFDKTVRFRSEKHILKDMTILNDESVNSNGSQGDNRLGSHKPSSSDRTTTVSEAPATTETRTSTASPPTSSASSNSKTTKSSSSSSSSHLSDMPLSRPEHHRDRIDKDMQLVATSIASSIEDESQWRLFCQERGGVSLLLRSIRDGARFLQDYSESRANDKTNKKRKTKKATKGTTTAAAVNHNDPSVVSTVASQYQQSFLAACNSCRALRDLCALSPDMAAVVTDEVLRANHDRNGELLQDISVLLNHAQDTEILLSQINPQRRKRLSIDLIDPRDMFRLEGRRDRRGMSVLGKMKTENGGGERGRDSQRKAYSTLR